MSIQDGRDRFFFGDLMDRRVKLGLSKAQAAELLGVHVSALYTWETHGLLSKLNDRNAEMVSWFLAAADRALDEFPDFAERFLGYARTAQKLGVPQEWLLDKFRTSQKVQDLTVDFGPLGLFINREDLPRMKGLVRELSDLQRSS